MAALVFISARSEDYQYAEPIYRFLRSQGLTVFFSQESLPELASSDYRKQIDDALDSAQHMIVVTSSRANVTSSWVEAEWGLFINEKRSGRKAGNLITVVAGNLRPADLPASLRYYEVIPFQPAAYQKILRYVTARSAPSSTTRTGETKITKGESLPGNAAGPVGTAGSSKRVPDTSRVTQESSGNPGTAVAVRSVPSTGRTSSIFAEAAKRIPTTRLMYGALVGAILGGSNGLLAGFYEVANNQSRMSPVIPGVIGMIFGATFGSLVAASRWGRIIGIAVAIIAGIIGAASEGPSAAVGMGLSFGTIAAVSAVAFAFLIKSLRKQ